MNMDDWILPATPSPPSSDSGSQRPNSPQRNWSDRSEDEDESSSASRTAITVIHRAMFQTLGGSGGPFLNPEAPPFFPSSSTPRPLVITEAQMAEFCRIMTSFQTLDERLEALQEITGMSLIQSNRIRCLGPHPQLRNFPPPKGSEVFVGNVPKHLNESHLYPLFRPLGAIYQIRLPMHNTGNVHRGYCFISYCTPEVARRVILELHGFEISEGYRIKVALAIDNRTLFVGKIPKDKGRDEIFQEISKISQNLVQIMVPRASNNSKRNRKNRGYIFAEYASHRDAATARNKFISLKIPLWGSERVVDWGNLYQPRGQGQQNVRNVNQVQDWGQRLRSPPPQPLFQPSLTPPPRPLPLGQGYPNQGAGTSFAHTFLQFQRRVATQSQRFQGQVNQQGQHQGQGLNWPQGGPFRLGWD